MRPPLGSGRKARQPVALGLILLLAVPAVAAPPPEKEEQPIVGRLLEPEGGRVAVQRKLCRCDPPDGRDDDSAQADILLFTVGTETDRDATPHFHPLATLAFDRTLGDGETGQWLAIWVYGPSPAGWRRTLRALLPLPVGAPKASEKKLAQLDERLEEIRESPEDASLQVPDPVVRLDTLGPSRIHGILGGLRRGLAWAGVLNPAQYIFRTYLSRRKDRRERNFQRTYLALQWLLNVEYTGEEEADWLASVNELRFHLLRNRSFFGRWVDHADSLELVYNYESDVRRQLGKTSSWLQSAANEHYLRYQPVYRYHANGATFPMGGVLYYDPRLGAAPDPEWWDIANPFDLPYNPHTHPEVQRRAREHPDELIPLAVYTFQTHLALRPIIAIDFFAPGNPRTRESTQQLMILLKNWLAITTGSLSLERIPYRLIAWAANKKGFTWLVDKSSRLGIEELRLSLESELYFDEEWRPLLMRRADQRVLNPLIKAGPEEERLAHIQYESLLAREAAALCRPLRKVREEMADRLDVPSGLSPAEERQELTRRLAAWRQEIRLDDFVSQPMEDFGSLRSLEEPLEFFLEREPANKKDLEKLLARLYAKLYIQQLRMSAAHRVPELEDTLTLARQVWQEVSAEVSEKDFDARRAKVEQQARAREARERREREKHRREALREFLKNSHKQLEQTVKAGCEASADAPAELDAHLVLLWEVVQAAHTEEALHEEFQRYAPRLRRDLARLEQALSTCRSPEVDPWRANWHQACLELTRALRDELARAHNLQVAGGG